MENDLEKLKEYFLVTLPPQEMEDIDLRIISDIDFASELDAAETALLEDYLENSLSLEDRKLFETNYLVTQERQNKLSFLRSLKNFAQESSMQPKLQENPSSFFDSIKSLFAPPKLAFGLAGLALVFAIGASGYFMWKSYDIQSNVLIALNNAQKTERPLESRISDFKYAPKIEGKRGNASDRNEELEFAELSARNLVRQNPSADNLHELGRVFLAQKKFDDAIAQFESGIKKNAQSSKLRNDLGVALMEKGRKNKLDNENIDKKNEETKPYLELFAKANEEFAKAIELDKTSLESYFNRALAIELTGVLPNQAKEAWENYLKLDATSKWADEARERLKKLELNKPVSKTKDEILKEFFDAKDANDDDRAWEIVTRNRSLSSGKLIPQQLAFLFIDYKSENNETEARESLEALVYLGKLEEKKTGDLFWRDLANYYQNAITARIPKLKQAKERYFQTVLAKDATIRQADYKKSISELEESRHLYLEAGNHLEPRLIDFLIGYLINREAKISDSSKKFELLAVFCNESKYKWLESQALTWLATNDLSERKLSKASRKAKDALELSLETDDLLNQQKNFAQLSEINFALGQFEKALVNMQRNLELGLGPEANLSERWRSLNLISRFFFKLKSYNSNIVFETEALALAKALGDRTFEFTSLVDLGASYSALGDFDEALALIEEGKIVSESFVDIAYRNKCLAHTNLQLGHTNRQRKQYSKAIDHFREAADYYDSGDFKVYSYEAHRGILLSSLSDSNDIEFQAELPQVLALFKNYREEIIEEQNRNSFFDNEQDVYDIATEYELSKSNFEKAFDFAEESRSRSLLDLQNSFAQVSRDEKQFEVEFSKDLSEPLKLTQIQSELPEETQLLVYSVLPERVAIWLITKDRFNTVTSEIKSSILQEKVAHYVELVSKQSEKAEHLELSEELHNSLISPVKNNLDTSKQLVIIPDKILSRLPFAALYSERYLVEEYRISYSPSANVFLNCSRKAKEFAEKPNENLLVIGNPSFNQAEYETKLPPLPSAKNEAEEIAKLYEINSLLTERNATKEKVKRSLKTADVFHFAGHYAVEESALLSSLILAGDTKEESGLANHEIIGEKLSQTRLIVLSACDTGIEKYYRGEGMIGASRTFLATNVPIVVASQWSVDSEATKELMVRFHQFRKSENLTTADALRQSQLNMLKNSKFSEPYYWAAFAAIGGFTKF